MVEKAEKIISGERMNVGSERKNYMIFASSQALERFLKRKICPTAENGIEYCTMERFTGNRILFTAEHAQTKRIAIEYIILCNYREQDKCLNYIKLRKENFGTG